MKRNMAEGRHKKNRAISVVHKECLGASLVEPVTLYMDLM